VSRRTRQWVGHASLGLPNHEEFIEAVKVILEDILNSGSFPEELNCTRLVVLNKTPSLTP
jgi:hypothetical protein